MNAPPVKQWYEDGKDWSRQQWAVLKPQLVEAWRQFMHLMQQLAKYLPQPPLRRKSSSDDSDNRRRKAKGSSNDAGNDYTVTAPDGEEVGQGENLAEAMRLWEELTERQGSIQDPQHRDVTPASDGDGKFLLLDANDQQLESYDSLNAAKLAWDYLTSSTGHIYDTVRRRDVTPAQPTFLTERQAQLAHEMVKQGALDKPSSHVSLIKRLQQLSPYAVVSEPLYVDVAKVHAMIDQINNMNLPIFGLKNATGKNAQGPTKKIKVTRRETVYEKRRRIVERTVPGIEKSLGRRPCGHPSDDMDVARISRTTDVTRVFGTQLALPPEVFARRLAKRELLRPQYFEDPGPRPTVKTQREWEEYLEPVVREWQEEITVKDDKTPSQLLAMIVDISPSMKGDNICLAAAVATVLIAKHLEDGSRYFIRPFTYHVGDLVSAESVKDKQKLAGFFMNGFFQPIGNGTDVFRAYLAGLEDVKRLKTENETPEILLITDDDEQGGSNLVAALHDRSQAKLHALVMRADHPVLEAKCETYSSLYFTNGKVTVNN